MRRIAVGALGLLVLLAAVCQSAQPKVAPPKLSIAAMGSVVHIGPPGAQLSTIVDGVPGGPSCTLVFLVTLDGKTALVQYPLWLQTPVVPPTPVPPTPPVPPELTGLAAIARDATALVAVDARKAGCGPLAAAYRQTAVDIRAGTIATTGALYAAQKAANRKALGILDDATAAKSPWLPWMARIGQELTARVGGAADKPAAPLAPLWDDIATGLEAVK